MGRPRHEDIDLIYEAVQRAFNITPTGHGRYQRLEAEYYRQETGIGITFYSDELYDMMTNEDQKTKLRRALMRLFKTRFVQVEAHKINRCPWTGRVGLRGIRVHLRD